MPLPRDQAWFAAKTHGWGWSLPLRWQGWVVMIGFIAALIAGAPLATRSLVLFVGFTVAIATVLLGICYWKGEAPRWRWGGDK
jgi:uncharacterized membrane protein YccC